MRLDARLGRLERTHAALMPRSCDACGNPLPTSIEVPCTSLTVIAPRVIGRDGRYECPPPDERDPADDYCGACGRLLHLRLYIKPPRLIRPPEEGP